MKKNQVISIIMVIVLAGVLSACSIFNNGKNNPSEKQGQTSTSQNPASKPGESKNPGSTVNNPSSGGNSTTDTTTSLKNYNGFWEANASKLGTTMKIEAINDSLIKVSIASSYNNGNKLPEADFECKIAQGSGSAEFVDSFDNKLEFKIKIEKTSIIVETKVLQRGQGYNIEQGSLTFTKKQ